MKSLINEKFEKSLFFYGRATFFRRCDAVDVVTMQHVFMNMMGGSPSKDSDMAAPSLPGNIDIDIVPPLQPEISPPPDPVPEPVAIKVRFYKVPKVESYLFPRFEKVDVSQKKGVGDLTSAFNEAWAAHPKIFMAPVPVLTRKGYDDRPVDVGGRRFKHAPEGEWMQPASAGHMGRVAWIVDKGLPLDTNFSSYIRRNECTGRSMC